MEGRIIFLLEEPSMKVLLDHLLPRLFPGWVEAQHFQCVPHEGKTDLDRSIPRKLRAWREPGARFVIVRDNDNADCVDLTARIRRQCEDAHRPDTLVRLVCQELESWYIGDLEALAEAFDEPRANTPRSRRRFTDPDSCRKPSVEIARLVPRFQKRSGARAMARHLKAEGNLSRSFRVFLLGVRQVAEDMGYQQAIR